MAGVCKLCGTPYTEGAKFCTECGAVIIERNEGNSVGVSESSTSDNAVNSDIVEKVENTTNPTTSETLNTDVSNTYGAENKENPTVYTDSYNRSNTSPYGGANYNAPNGSNPYGGGNYNATNGSNPYGGGNYNVPNGSNSYGGGNYNAPNGSNPYGGGNYNAPNGSNSYGGGNYNAPNGSNPYGGGNYNAPNGSNSYGGGNYNAPNGGNPYSGAPQMQPQRGFSVGALVLSIINLLLGCCSCTGFIFGGAGLAFAIMAKNTKLDEEAVRYNRISVILNVIGIVTTILVFIAAFAIGFMEGFGTIE